MRPAALCAIAAVVGLFAAPARGEGDHDVAQSTVDSLSKDVAHRAIVADPIERAKLALERSARLRALGDEAHARVADGLAREWAETARDILRAADAEAKGAEVRRKALDEAVQLDRTRALADEGIARLGRLQAELDEAQRAATDGPKQDRHAVEVHDGDKVPAKNVLPSISPTKRNAGAPP